MRLTCPTCGAIASLDAWALDEDARMTVAGLASLPPGLVFPALRYLGLFRKPGSPRGLGWGRARRLVDELGGLVREQSLCWESAQELRNAPCYWEQALAVILEREDKGKIVRPLGRRGSSSQRCAKNGAKNNAASN